MVEAGRAHCVPEQTCGFGEWIDHTLILKEYIEFPETVEYLCKLKNILNYLCFH